VGQRPVPFFVVLSGEIQVLQLLVAKGAAKLSCAHPLYAVHLEDGGRIDARALIIASGAKYRKTAIANVSQFEGAGVYYAAARMEAQRTFISSSARVGWPTRCRDTSYAESRTILRSSSERRPSSSWQTPCYYAVVRESD
jgi:hypothetical protein